MATQTQSEYISDLAVLKTKEFKEVKELVVKYEIVGPDAETVLNALTINEMTNAMTDEQASKFIDVLIATQEPTRSTSYSTKRVQKTVDLLDDIKTTITNWSF